MTQKPSQPMLRSVSMAAKGLRLVRDATWTNHKGSCGRVAVIGGSDDYSGAPYLAAMSALRCGADLAFVFCPPSVAPIIKSYSPDLVVRGVLCVEHLDRLVDALKSCHSVIIGPGLGTSAETQELFGRVLDALLEQPYFASMPVVLDACALKMLTMQRHDGRKMTLQPRFILTPNSNEMRVLREAMGAVDSDANEVDCTAKVAAHWNATVLLKGTEDLVRGSGGRAPYLERDEDLQELEAATAGSPRRAGGQGDVLCGAVGAFAAFSLLSLKDEADWAAAASAASATVKATAQHVYGLPGMQTYIASDLLGYIGAVREKLLQIVRR